MNYGKALRQSKLYTNTIIGACVGIYAVRPLLTEKWSPLSGMVETRTARKIIQTTQANTVLTNYGLMQQHRWWLLLTHSFQHADIGHLAINMFVFNSFGPLTYMLYGPVGFISLWAGGAVAGGCAGLYSTKSKRGLQGSNVAHVGASGALNALMTAVVVARPQLRMSLLFLPIPIPGWAFSGLFATYSAFSDANQSGNSGGTMTSHMGHLGGMAFGLGMGLLTRGKFQVR